MSSALILLATRARACVTAYRRRHSLRTPRWSLNTTKRPAQARAGCRCEHRRVVSSTNAAASMGVSLLQFLLVPCFGLTVTPRKAVQIPYHIFDTDVVNNQLSGFVFGLESRVGIHAP